MPLAEDQAALLPEDVRSDPGLQSFNDLGGLAKSYLETKSMVGRSIQLPSKDSKPEDVDKWAGETGAKLKEHGFTVAKLSERPPETPDAYDFKLEGVDPQVVKDDKILGSFRTSAHKLGLNQQQASDLVNWYLKDAVPTLQNGAGSIEMVEDPAQVEKVLSGVFRGETKATLVARDQAVNQLKSEIPELEDFLSGTAPFGKPWMTNKDHPAMVKLLKFVAESKQQDFGGNIEGLGANDSISSTEEEIRAVRARTDVNDDKKGEMLLNLYKKLTFLEKREGKDRAA